MKKVYVADILRRKCGNVELLGWVSRIHRLGKIVFITVDDSTGSIQIVINKNSVDKQLWDKAGKLVLETAVKVKGKMANNSLHKNKEILADELEIVGSSDFSLSPSPRSDIDIFDPRFAKLLLDKRHIYIRNPRYIYILKVRHIIIGFIRRWFDGEGFVEIQAPILTPVNLYEDKSAMQIKIDKRQVFLTQCVGFYLEAAVHALEKVYNIGPSFRAEETHSPRHLMEYWHIKSEVAFANLEDIIDLVERLIKDLTIELGKNQCFNTPILGTKFCLDGCNIPFPRIKYTEAIDYLHAKGVKVEFGRSLGPKGEVELSRKFKDTLFWITGMPRKVEPFPYVVDSADSRVTRTADLIASRGFGELLGVAEKISDINSLKGRMREKGKLNDLRYKWVEEVHQLGCVPHAAMGMGVERLVRWILGIPHVKDTIPFPRLFRRRVYP
ncbi:MAG: hypothetical protein HYU80_02515 [Candidatus Blackburnbacteria bacterium]|nr:hypothetical protein [Candidatus Blackburnbacteria bacterium]